MLHLHTHTHACMQAPVITHTQANFQTHIIGQSPANFWFIIPEYLHSPSVQFFLSFFFCRGWGGGELPWSPNNIFPQVILLCNWPFVEQRDYRYHMFRGTALWPSAYNTHCLWWLIFTLKMHEWKQKQLIFSVFVGALRLKKKPQ